MSTVNDDTKNSTTERKPGQRIRPTMDCDKATQLVESLYGFSVVSISQLHGYHDRNFHVLVASRTHSNPHVEQISPHGYVLKVTNSIDSLKPHVDGEHSMMRALYENNIECPLPVMNIHGAEKSLEKLDDEDAVYMVRLLTFVPGELVETVPFTTQLIYQLGQTLASVNDALQSLDHPALNKYSQIWSLSSVPRLRQFTYAIDDVDKWQLVLDVIDAFECEVLPNIAQFSAGVIHGDFNEQNVIVRQDAESAAVTITGVIDFGDSERGPYIFDVAIAVMYCMLQSEAVDAVDVCGHVLAGYLSRRQRALTGVERAALWPCVAARFAQSLTMGAYTYSLEPTNHYVLKTANRGWMLLRRLWKETSREQLDTRLDTLLASYGYYYPPCHSWR